MVIEDHATRHIVFKLLLGGESYAELTKKLQNKANQAIYQIQELRSLMDSRRIQPVSSFGLYIVYVLKMNLIFPSV